ncbi:uncharacterized protein LAJ45_05542 [Morchella importuna]|uniref:uncharacterized protein n=1 Tax=Morchella importuna TaxID=1174673 RepID=UPI001E8E60F7|nr:uncharacterized protein LAJ45_05542 [Morchella importuna]KAH8150331.1 hypothetical protein LAJ45_05542 [Morchella importuna]
MKFYYNGRLTTAVFTIFWTATSAHAAPTITLPLSAFTSSVESDKAAIYYPNTSNSTPIVLGNDGSPAGGFHTWSFPSDSSPSQMTELNFKYTGRTKLVEFVYNLGGKDVIVTLSQSDSLLRFFDSVSVSELPVMGGRKKIWGDFSSWCFWKSAEGHQYFYLFGKKIVSLFLIREGQKSGIEVLEIQSFPVPIEAKTCIVSYKTSFVYFGGDSGILYTFPALESITIPENIAELGKAPDEINGLAIYSGNLSNDYLLVALKESLNIYSASNFTLLGSATFSDELELGDIALYQPAFGTAYPDGILAFTAETDTGKAFPKYETDPNGSDGDDPAIWIAPGNSTENSRIITTTKSELGAGFGVFDLTGKKLQTMAAEEPNNVDVIYDFPVGNRTADLVFAACRGDNTLCLCEITSSGELISIPGGTQPTTVEDFDVYGSCVYRSYISGKQYLFVNSKTSEYLQFELTSTVDGTLNTTLVRTFMGGNGGQVEGCVADDENGFLILGEEPYGLWRYDAEPNGTDEGYLIDHVNTGGNLIADVEGVTLIYGETSTDGYIFVSCQGVSAYNVYQRAHPNEYVMTFSIIAGSVDGVTNTDGITAVGTSLGSIFPRGLIVVHDDVNEESNGTASSEAAFKLVDLGDVLDAGVTKHMGLLGSVNQGWNPRDRLSKHNT